MNARRVRRVRRCIALGPLLLAGIACSGSSDLPTPFTPKASPQVARPVLPEAASRILDTPDVLEVLSLDPRHTSRPSKGAFHGWEVLGRESLREQGRRQELVAALEKAIRESDGAVALCFEPRHGIHATSGANSVDLVICFHCLQVEVYLGSSQASSVPTTESAERVLDRLLKDAGVRLAPKGDS